MYWYLTIFSLLLLFAAATSTIIALYAWKRRPVPGSVAFAIAMLAITQWSLAFLLHIVSVDAVNKLAWVKFQYVGILILPIAWLVFTRQYTGRPVKWASRQAIFVAIFSLITFVLILTSEAHGLFWQDVRLITFGGMPVLTFTPSWWYWLNLAFLYGCYLAGSLMIMTSPKYEIASLYPHQAFFLVLALSLPWFALALHFAGLNAINLMPLAFALSSIVIARFVLRFRFVKKTPLAQCPIVNNLENGVLLLDQAQTIVDANPVALRILQRPFADLIGRPLKEVWSDLAAQYEAIAEKPRDVVRLGNEEVRYYEASLSRLLDWRKLPSNHVLTLYDITYRKQAETLRNDVTRSLIHDLRSPTSNSLFALQMLRGSLELDPASPDNKHLVDIMFTSTEKVLHLINSMLDVDRMENGKLPVNCTAVSLDNVIRRVVEGQSAHAHQKQIRMQYYIPQDLPPAWVDANLLERILQNLVDNSLKFSAVGGMVVITAVPVPDIVKGKTHLEVSVSDDGPGLSPDLAHTAFDKFVTGDSEASGSGLGLAFCQTALAAHGEQIWASNNPDSGVTFTFSLPIAPIAYKDTKFGTAVNGESNVFYQSSRFIQAQPELAAYGR